MSARAAPSEAARLVYNYISTHNPLGPAGCPSAVAALGFLSGSVFERLCQQGRAHDALEYLAAFAPAAGQRSDGFNRLTEQLTKRAVHDAMLRCAPPSRPPPGVQLRPLSSHGLLRRDGRRDVSLAFKAWQSLFSSLSQETTLHVKAVIADELKPETLQPAGVPQLMRLLGEAPELAGALKHGKQAEAAVSQGETLQAVIDVMRTSMGRVDYAAKQLSGVRAELEASRQATARAAAETAAAKEANGKLEAENQRLADEKRRLQEQLSAEQKQRSLAAQASSRLEAENQRLADEKRRLEEQLSAEQKQHSLAAQASSRLETENQRLADEKRRLEEQLSAEQKQRSLATQAHESLQRLPVALGASLMQPPAAACPSSLKWHQPETLRQSETPKPQRSGLPWEPQDDTLLAATVAEVSAGGRKFTWSLAAARLGRTESSVMQRWVNGHSRQPPRDDARAATEPAPSPTGPLAVDVCHGVQEIESQESPTASQPTDPTPPEAAVAGPSSASPPSPPPGANGAKLAAVEKSPSTSMDCVDDLHIAVDSAATGAVVTGTTPDTAPAHADAIAPATTPEGIEAEAVTADVGAADASTVDVGIADDTEGAAETDAAEVDAHDASTHGATTHGAAASNESVALVPPAAVSTPLAPAQKPSVLDAAPAAQATPPATFVCDPAGPTTSGKRGPPDGDDASAAHPYRPPAKVARGGAPPADVDSAASSGATLAPAEGKARPNGDAPSALPPVKLLLHAGGMHKKRQSSAPTDDAAVHELIQFVTKSRDKGDAQLEVLLVLQRSGRMLAFSRQWPPKALLDDGEDLMPLGPKEDHYAQLPPLAGAPRALPYCKFVPT